MQYRIFEGASMGSPRSAEWHIWRHAGIGGSDAGIIAAHAGLLDDPEPWQRNIEALAREKREPIQFDNSKAWTLRRGLLGEKPAARAYEAQTGNLIAPVFGEMDAWPIARASFDGITLNEKIVAEVKCPTLEIMDLAKRKIVAPCYVPQIAHQALVAWGEPAGWSDDLEVHFIAYNPDTGEIHVAEVNAKADLAAFAVELLAAERSFWHAVATGADLFDPAWRALAEAYHAALQQVESAKAGMIAWCAERNRQRMAGLGVTASFEHRPGRVDYPALIESLKPDAATVESFRKPAVDVWSVRPTPSVQ